MSHTVEPTQIREIDEPESRWGVASALLAAGALYMVLAKSLTMGPSWLPLACVAVLEIPAWIALANDREEAATVLGHCISATLTGFLIVSVWLLVRRVVEGHEPAMLLL